MNWQILFIIGSGGFIGAVGRFYTVAFVNALFPFSFPIGTMFVNILGSLVLGGLFAYFSINPNASMGLKSFLMTGLLGAFTTFSTFALEAILLLDSIKSFLIYTFCSTIGSMVVAFIAYRSVLYLMR